MQLAGKRGKNVRQLSAEEAATVKKLEPVTYSHEIDLDGTVGRSKQTELTMLVLGSRGGQCSVPRVILEVTAAR